MAHQPDTVLIPQELPPRGGLGEYFIFFSSRGCRWMLGDPDRLVRKVYQLIQCLGMTIVSGPTAYRTGDNRLCVVAVIMESHIILYVDLLTGDVELHICTCGEGALKVNVPLITRWMREAFKGQRVRMCSQRRWTMGLNFPRFSGDAEILPFPSPPSVTQHSPPAHAAYRAAGAG